MFELNIFAPNAVYVKSKDIYGAQVCVYVVVKSEYYIGEKLYCIVKICWPKNKANIYRVLMQGQR